MHNLSRLRKPRTFVLSFVAVLALLLTVACGSSDDDATATGATGATGSTPATSMTTPATTGDSTETTSGTPAADATMPAGATMPSGMSGMELGMIGMCFEANTDAQMIEDLQAGDTATAEEVYTSCLQDVLPPALVADLEPVIAQAADCGTVAAQDLTESDLAEIEAGDRTAIEQVSAGTLECLSDELGVPLS